mmetsp:Transcript_13351/g.25300  ORF Transcript_13351/g.25300 Transcript_13351/m.25300 type:complete len:117 (+) Transcript_13351:118-468(+)
MRGRTRYDAQQPDAMEEQSGLLPRFRNDAYNLTTKLTTTPKCERALPTPPFERIVTYYTPASLPLETLVRNMSLARVSRIFSRFRCPQRSMSCPLPPRTMYDVACAVREHASPLTP